MLARAGLELLTIQCLERGSQGKHKFMCVFSHPLDGIDTKKKKAYYVRMNIKTKSNIWQVSYS